MNRQTGRFAKGSGRREPSGARRAVDDLRHTHGNNIPLPDIIDRFTRLYSAYGALASAAGWRTHIQELVEELRKLRPIIEPSMASCNPEVLAAALHLCSKLKYPSELCWWYAVCLKNLERKARTAGPGPLSDVAHTVSRASASVRKKLKWPTVIQRLIPAYVAQVSTATPSMIANFLWAVKAAGVSLDKQTVAAVLDRLCEERHTASATSLADSITAVAESKQRVPGEHAQPLLAAFARKISAAGPRHISRVMRAVVSMSGHTVPKDVLQQLLTGMADKLLAATMQDIVDTLSAAARCREHVPREQVEALLTEWSAKLPAASAQDAVDGLWAAASMQPHPILPAALSPMGNGVDSILRNLGQMDLVDLAKVAHACGKLGYCNAHLLRPVFNRVRYLVEAGRWGQRHIRSFTNLCWAAAVTSLWEVAEVVCILAVHCSTYWGCLEDVGRQKLCQAHLWLSPCGQQEGLSGRLTTPQLSQCMLEWQKQAQVTRVSSLQETVFHAAQTGLGDEWTVQLEVLTYDGVHSIDMLATYRQDGTQVAIEVDGHESHHRLPDHAPTGKTRFRNMALIARGYLLVVVHPLEWNALDGRPEKQQAYMKRKVEQVMRAAGRRM